MSDWTVDTILTHILHVIEQQDSRYKERAEAQEKRYGERAEAQDKAVQVAMTSADKAVLAAFAATEKAVAKEAENAERWRQNANEWRQAMNDREGKFALASKVDDLSSRIQLREGQQVGMAKFWGMLVGVIAVIGGIITVFLAIR